MICNEVRCLGYLVTPSPWPSAPFKNQGFCRAPLQYRVMICFTLPKVILYLENKGCKSL